MAARKLSEDTKRCTGPCGQIKPLDEFHKDSDGLKGRQSFCKDCKRVYCQGWWAKNPGRAAKYSRDHRAMCRAYLKKHGKPMLEHPAKKICPRCGIPRLKEEFSVCSRRRTGRREWCKYCRARAKGKWYDRNRIRERAKLRIRHRLNAHANSKTGKILRSRLGDHTWMRGTMNNRPNDPRRGYAN